MEQWVLVRTMGVWVAWRWLAAILSHTVSLICHTIFITKTLLSSSYLANQNLEFPQISYYSNRQTCLLFNGIICSKSQMSNQNILERLPSPDLYRELFLQMKCFLLVTDVSTRGCDRGAPGYSHFHDLCPPGSGQVTTLVTPWTPDQWQ